MRYVATFKFKNVNKAPNSPPINPISKDGKKAKIFNEISFFTYFSSIAVILNIDSKLLSANLSIV